MRRGRFVARIYETPGIRLLHFATAPTRAPSVPPFRAMTGEGHSRTFALSHSRTAVSMSREKDGVLLIGGDPETATAVRAAAREAGAEPRIAAALGDGLRALADRRWRVTLLWLDAT